MKPDNNFCSRSGKGIRPGHRNAPPLDLSFSEGEHEANAITPLRWEYLHWAALSPERSKSSGKGTALFQRRKTDLRYDSCAGKPFRIPAFPFDDESKIRRN